jgi:hypothetical protein
MYSEHRGFLSMHNTKMTHSYTINCGETVKSSQIQHRGWRKTTSYKDLKIPVLCHLCLYVYINIHAHVWRQMTKEHLNTHLTRALVCIRVYIHTCTCVSGGWRKSTWYKYLTKVTVWMTSTWETYSRCSSGWRYQWWSNFSSSHLPRTSHIISHLHACI